MATAAHHVSVLSTKRGRQTLVLLCAVAFLDFVDASIVNVALPSIRGDLHFSVQSLQWVLSGYLLTYGGFMLLGGRASDLVARRRLLVAGTLVFGVSSLIGGVASSEVMLVGARLVQGMGAAMMIPSALSILTTTFTSGPDRHKTLGAWGAMAGLGSAAGVFLGGVLSEGPGWRWVFFVNLPVCVGVLAATFRLVRAENGRASRANFAGVGAVLATAGMLLLVYALVEAPDIGWGDTRTIGELAGAAALVAAFTLNEHRHRNPLFPFSILRIKGLAAADITQVIAMAGFYAMFFFITLYMQSVLGYSQIEAGSAYLPATLGVGIASAIAAELFAHRHAADHRRRRARLGLRGLLAVAHPGGRFLRLGPAARPGDHVLRARRGLRRGDDRGQRRGSRRQGRPRRRARQHLHMARRRARIGDLLGDLDVPRPGPPGCARLARRSADLGLPASARRMQHLPGCRRGHRASHHQHARPAGHRTDPRTGPHPRNHLRRSDARATRPK